jgi:hypothetical protein
MVVNYGISLHFSLLLDIKAPLMRPADPLASITHSKYYGVVKIDGEKDEYATEFPKFVVDNHAKSSFKLSPYYSSNRNKVVLRDGIVNEYLAGQIYAYVAKVLYGKEGVAATVAPMTMDSSKGTLM